MFIKKMYFAAQIEKKPRRAPRLRNQKGQNQAGDFEKKGENTSKGGL